MDTVKLSAPMPDGNKCPQCGTPMPTGALAGLCPACLLQMGAAADTVTDGKQPTFQPPTVAELAPLFPQLEILELIGKGGMGAVYKARQKQLDRLVALKILPPGIGNDAAFAERFAREAKALAKLNHPGIVTLYEFGSTSGYQPSTLNSQLFYFLMEFVDGVNLRQLLHASRISAREALAIVPQICDALQFAHDQGIVHRDIKPENILMDRRGRVKVADFGLAKIVGGSEPLTPSLSPSDGERVADRPGEGTSLTGEQVMGTPQYMSPEQRDNPGEVDHRADIYALGVVFYQMLTGELPGKTIAPPSTKVLIDVRLDEVVLRALEKKPELRYQQVSEVKTCVETIASNPESPKARSEKPEGRLQPKNFNPLGLTEASFSKIIEWGWRLWFIVLIFFFVISDKKFSETTNLWGGSFVILSLITLVQALFHFRKERIAATSQSGSRGRESAPSETEREPDDLRRLTSAATSEVPRRSLWALGGLVLVALSLVVAGVNLMHTKREISRNSNKTHNETVKLQSQWMETTRRRHDAQTKVAKLDSQIRIAQANPAELERLTYERVAAQSAVDLLRTEAEQTQSTISSLNVNRENSIKHGIIKALIEPMFLCLAGIIALSVAWFHRRSDEQSRRTSAATGRVGLTAWQIFFRAAAVAAFVWLGVVALSSTITSLLPRTYVGTARVKIAGATTTPSGFDPYRMQTELERIQYPELLQRAGEKADVGKLWKDILVGNSAAQEEQIAFRLRNGLKVRSKPNTDTIEISFYDNSNACVPIANWIATLYCEQTGATMLERAVGQSRPVRPRPEINLLIGGLVGGLLALVAGGLTALYLKSRTSRSSGSSGPEEPQPEAVSRPWSLFVIAGLFLWTGIPVAWEIGSGLREQAFTIHFGAIGLPIGIGLLRLRPRWRIAALVCVFLPFLTVAYAGVMGTLGKFSWLPNATLMISGRALTGTSQVVAIVVLCTFLTLALVWVFKVLTQPKVKALFQSGRPAQPGVEWAVLFGVILFSYAVTSLTGIPVSRNQNPAGQTTGAAELTFGPVVERVVMAFDENPAQACLDFGSGEFRVPPATVADRIRLIANEQEGRHFTDLNGPGDERHDWLKTSGVDLIGCLDATGNSRFKYLGQPPHYRNGSGSFDLVSPSEVIQAVQASPFFKGDKPNLPAAYVNYMNPNDAATKKASYIIFRAHDGDVGVMKVLGTNQTPRGVKIHYKLVQNIVTTANPVSMPPTAAPTLNFGPVIERKVSGAVDLDNGQLLSEGAFAPEKIPIGIDAIAVVSPTNNGLYGIQMRAMLNITSSDWETWTAQQVNELAAGSNAKPWSEPCSLGAFPSPTSFLFQTREGSIGLLQITGFTENPRGVKIRYKLVQNVPASSGPVVSAISPIHSPVNEMLLADVHLSDPQKPQLLCLSNGAGFGTAQLFPGGKLGAKMLTQPQNIRQLRQRGIDIGCEVTSKTWGLLLWDCSVHPIGKIGWEIADAPDKKHAGWSNQSLNDIFRDMPIPKLDSYRVTTGDFPQTLLIKTRAGDCYVLEATGANINPPGVMIRYKRVQNEVTVKTKPTPSPAQLAEPPKLQFLAWQDEWKTNKPFAARHLDGSPVTNATELQWLKEVQPGWVDVSSSKLNPEPRFVHIWFSHPGLHLAQNSEITLQDESGIPLKLGGQSSVSGGGQEANERNGQLGWKYWTLSPSEATNLPARVTVQLRYTVGPLERTQELVVTPKTSTSMSLEGGSQLNGVGQNVDGQAFVSIAVDAKKMSSRKFGVIAVDKAGRQVSPTGAASGGTVGAGVSVESFEFGMSLADVAKFVIGSRSIRTNDWKDVVLRGN